VDLGLIYEQQQQFDQAIFYYKQALEIDPGLIWAQEALQRLGVERGNDK